MQDISLEQLFPTFNGSYTPHQGIKDLDPNYTILLQYYIILQQHGKYIILHGMNITILLQLPADS